ncbi:hypothetical protein [Streptomyces cyaneofuscatus]|uniref:hypothetical protein n=1 Tax=Streptomyces cyaneofuscatus TaxID=66883 RepID=UPI00343ECF1F
MGQATAIAADLYDSGMITSSVDPASRSFANGQALGMLFVIAVAMVAIWITTQSWRRGPVPTSAIDAEQASALAIRRDNIVRGVLLVTAAAGLIWVFTYRGYAPAPEAAPVDREPVASSPSATAGAPEVTRVIDAAPRVGEYRLLTDAEAAEYERLVPAKPESGERWFYNGPGEGPVDALLQIRAVEGGAELDGAASSKAMSDDLGAFFAGARATEITAFEAGPWGGQLSCGFAQSDGGRQIVCAWVDSTTRGHLGLMDEASLSRAGEIALQFRTASEKRA